MYKLGFVIAIFILSSLAVGDIDAQQAKLATFQEAAQVIIDQSISNNVTASITHQSTSNQEIRIPTELINKIHDADKVLAVIVTNEERCVLGVQEDTCVMINISREGIEGGIKAIQGNATAIGDLLIGDVNEAFDIESKFHSVYLHHMDESNVALETSGVISGRGTISAVYTIPREDTESMYQKFSSLLLPKIIRDGGGFYDVAKKLSAEDNSRITISIIPSGEQALFQLKLSVDYPNTASSINVVSPLEFLKIDELKRSTYFANDFYPLNSLLKVVVLASEPIKVDVMNTKLVPTVIKDGEILPEFTTDGWFFDTDTGTKIEGTYLFGEKFSTSKQELVFTLTTFEKTQQDNGSILTPSIPVGVDSLQIVVLVGIIMAAAGASIYYLKGIRKKR